MIGRGIGVSPIIETIVSITNTTVIATTVVNIREPVITHPVINPAAATPNPGIKTVTAATLTDIVPVTPALPASSPNIVTSATGVTGITIVAAVIDIAARLITTGSVSVPLLRGRRRRWGWPSCAPWPVLPSLASQGGGPLVAVFVWRGGGVSDPPTHETSDGVSGGGFRDDTRAAATTRTTAMLVIPSVSTNTTPT